MRDLDARLEFDLEDFITATALSPDGKSFACGTAEGEVVVFDTKTFARRLRVHAHKGGTQSVSLLDDRVASGGQDGLAKVHTFDGSLSATVPLETRAWADHVAFSPNGEHLAIAVAKQLVIANRDGVLRHRIEAAPSAITGLSWNKRSTEVAIAAYGGLRSYKALDGTQGRFYEWKGSLLSVAWSPDEKVIACGSQDASVHFWRVATGNDSEMAGYPSKPKIVVWDSLSQQLATSGSEAVCIWSFSGKGPEGTSPVQLGGHGKLVNAIAFHPRKSLLASGGLDGTVFLWDPKKGASPLGFLPLEGEITGLHFSAATQDLLVTDSNGKVLSVSV